MRTILHEMLSESGASVSNQAPRRLCATFERANAREPWVQVEAGLLNMFYPRDQPPLEQIGQHVQLPAGTVCLSWEAGKFATLELSPMSADELAVLVEDLFGDFYELPRNTPLESEVTDLG